MDQQQVKSAVIPSVNIFVNSACNMRCKFCFAPPRASSPMEIGDVKRVIEECASIGIQKVTFVGGEPLLYPSLAKAISAAKNNGLITCVVTNARLLRESWVDSIASSLDWIGLSVDSLIPSTNADSGRSVNGTPIPPGHYRSIALTVKEAGIRLKINTTVTAWNWRDDLSSFIRGSQPDRWKIFQATHIEGLNSWAQGEFAVSPEQFRDYVFRHQHLSEYTTMVSESAEEMTESYLMISPDGKFFDNAGGRYRFSRPILKEGIRAALDDVSIDWDRFVGRGGLYQWTK